MGIMVYSLSWVMQDLYHQPYLEIMRLAKSGYRYLRVVICNPN